MKNKDPQDWNSYWVRKNRNFSHNIYSTLAWFYRKYIIEPSLTKKIKKYVVIGKTLLHAGCGSGKVDVNLIKNYEILALDISENALKIYSENNPSAKKIIHGSIFEIPLDDSSVDCVYNLGVMEHFNDKEINKILNEFHRVLKEDGLIILFWPPKKGLTVRVLKFVHWVLLKIFKSENKLHPDEITHIESANHATEILSSAGFVMINYEFNFKDLFTHAIIVGKKKH